jgi:ABC-type glycerol-3-phosphate transport system substrate-binding protein
MRRLIILLAICFGTLLVGCDLLADLSDSGGNETAPPLSPATPVPTTTSAPQSTVEFTQPLSPTSSPAPDSPQVLRLWLPPEIAVRTEEGASVLINQLESFNSRYPNLEIVVEQKAAGGQGGILSYLRTGHEVAPTILPDLIALPVELLPEAASQELIFPLDDLLTADTLDALYPAAAELGVVNGEWIGYPFALTNLTHLVYDRNLITGTIPLQWSEFISNTENTVVFPAAGRQNATLGLQFYLAAGGRWLNDAGQPDLQLEPLTRSLEQLSLGRAALAESVFVGTQAEAWQLYESGAVSSIWTTSDFYLTLPFVGENNGLSVAPGPEGPLIPLASGWLWLISTPDPGKRALVAELLTFLVEPQNLGEWSSASAILPARRDALATWPGDNSYRTFMSGQLETAQAFPLGSTNRMMEALGVAVLEVLSTPTSPQVIAEETIAALRQ